MSDLPPLEQTRWCNRQHDLINAAIDVEDFNNALRLIDNGFAKVVAWEGFEFWLPFLWSSKAIALKGLGRDAEAEEAMNKAKEHQSRNE
ncbi:hypothetical protein NLG97_g7095 [Lecanicillium saksenae]|uniref:Uncharacterized protein n=1 Tax=Lecanicillium saksenae TaxID=468837 RepID=A0ACC1QNB8_9HYPO|nr:hypothetical protein NLG97_g7095 [Lecanicillium saksenae]